MLPDGTTLTINAEKISVYLLNESHPKNRGKAKFLFGFGFSLDAPDVLADAIAAHGFAHGPGEFVPQPKGPPRYVCEGSVAAPDGREVPLRTVWEVSGPTHRRLLTAVPLTR